MTLQVVGAGLPRTGTTSLGMALETLLGGPRHHMSAIPGHPFDLGDGWSIALAGGIPDWDTIYDGYISAVDWPSSAFWREVSEHYPDALVVLSVRDSPHIWYEIMAATVLPAARLALQPGWPAGRHLVDLFERFTDALNWDDPDLLMAAYERHNTVVRATLPPSRLLEWTANQGLFESDPRITCVRSQHLQMLLTRSGKTNRKPPMGHSPLFVGA